jgi:acyl-CoA thioesterase-1
MLIALLFWISSPFSSGPEPSDRETLSRQPATNTQSNVSEPILKIIAFGDSLTAGYGLPLNESYPAQLERTLIQAGYPVTVINAGISGETTAGARERASFIRSQSPDLILLGTGGNDALRFLPLDNTRNNLREVLSILTGSSDGAPPEVFLLRIQAPGNAGNAFKQQFDALYPALANEFNIKLVPFVVEEVFQNSERMLEDGIHPNAEGYAWLVKNHIYPAIINWLDHSQQIHSDKSTKSDTSF